MQARPMTVTRAAGALCLDCAGSRARAEHLGGELLSDDPLRVGGGVDHRLQVDPGRHAHVLDHVHEFLGGDVAGGARRVRAATEASKSDTPSSSAVSTLASPVPLVLWKCRLSATSGWAERNAPTSSRTRRGVAMPVVSQNEMQSAPSATAREATRTTRGTG